MVAVGGGVFVGFGGLVGGEVGVTSAAGVPQADKISPIAIALPTIRRMTLSNSNEHFAIFIDNLSIHPDLRFLCHIADHIPMDGALIHTSNLGVTGA